MCSVNPGIKEKYDNRQPKSSNYCMHVKMQVYIHSSVSVASKHLIHLIQMSRKPLFQISWHKRDLAPYRLSFPRVT